ncbi:hypothetical protein H7J86_24600 [Mycobacterium hackensackense]|uniref:hypothetical protein n=1 Tax=Mycobacterium hackensackense TaxID=228909 RepID=UPI002265A74A|nr:hypothetical protein [Mycobacterium hackensackense]MCV7255348.1 hypothetical protein [Mycobacterium hackensackense]
MAIHLDIFTRLDERGVRRDADKVEDTFDRAADRSGRAFGEKLAGGIERSVPRVQQSAQRMEKAVDKVADAVSRVRVEQARYDEVQKKSDATDRQKIERSEALAKAKRAEAAAVRAAMRAHEDDSNNISRMSTLNTSLSLMGKGTASLAIGAAVPALAVVSGAAVTAAGSLALLPGAAMAAAGAFGTLKIATLGFGDAMSSLRDPEKFSEALRSLSPNAQQAALSVQSLLPAFDRLKNASQDALFDGVSGQLQELSRTLMPTIEKMTTQLSSSFNEMFMGITDQLMSGPGQAAITNITTNISKAFDALAPAAAPFTQAMADIMSVGSDFLPDLARAATDAAFQFSSFINEAKQSGELKQWISEGLDALKEVGSLIVGLGKAVGSLAPVAKEVLPVLVDALEDISGLLREHPGLVWGVVGAFGAWKTIQGVAALTTSLQTISTLLGVGLPAAATTGATGITAALAKVSVPTWLTFLTKWGGAMGVGLQSDVKDSTEVGLPEVKYDDQGRPYLPGSRFDPSKPQPNTWDPNAVVPGGGNGPHGPTGRRLVGPGAPFTLTQPAEPGMWWPGYGKSGQRGGGFFSTDTGGGAGGPKLPDAPVLPYSPPLSTAPTAALASAENSLYDAQFKVEEKKARLNQLEASNAATANDIQDARNDVARAEQDRHEAEMRLNEARQTATQKGIKQLNGMADQLGDIGAKLDQDFGLSKGLPGLAENLFKFVANLAAAPLLGQLGAISAMNPSQGGYGALGILGAQGAFGPQYTGLPQQSVYGYAASAMGPAAVGNPNVASMMALAQSASGKTAYAPASDLVNGLADCSGSISDLVEMLRSGQTTPGRLFTTANFGSDAEAAKVGALPGFQPGALNVGVTPYGPGAHMAATLPNGVNFEGGGGTGGGAQYGGSAAGALDRQFQKQYYFPLGPTAGPAASASPTTVTPADIYGPANTNPGLNNPGSPGWGTPGIPSTILPGGGGQGPVLGANPMGPGVGAAAGTPLGGLPPVNGSGGGGVGISGDGAIGMAMQAGGMALDMMAPGAGQAAQTGMKLINRAIEFGSQAAGIGVSGLMETLLPTGGSQLANSSWFTKIAGGIAGAGMALPNTAGQSAAAMAGKPDQSPVDPAAGGAGGNTYQTTINAGADRSGAGIARDWDYHMRTQGAAPGM